MPPEKPMARSRKLLFYISFCVFSFLLGLLLTFPYDTLKKILVARAEAGGYVLKVRSVGPGVGLVARGLSLQKKGVGSKDVPAEALEIESVSLRPTLFPPGLSIHASLLGGDVYTQVGLLGSTRINVELDDIDFSKSNFKGFSGVDLNGKLRGELSLSIPNISVGKGQKEPDLAGANGNVRLKLEGVKVNGGTIRVVIPAFGNEPTPVDLPRIELGDFTSSLKIEKGMATVDKLSLLGKGLEASGVGTIRLARRLEYSELGVDLRLKTDPDFQKSLGVYGMAFSQLRSDPKDTAWKVARLTGYLGRPAFR